MSLIPYPNIPPLPGVPAINRNSAGYVGAALNVVAQLLPDGLFGTKWAILDATTGSPILIPDNFVSYERVSESKIPVYPLEQGAFASYNKVRLPKTYKLTVSCNGNKSTSKINFLTAIQKMETGKNSDQSPVTVKIVTPESTSPAVCLIHTDQRREARSGATLLIFQLTFQEVISIPSPTTSTAEPSGTATQSFGQLSPTTTPTGNFGSINPNSRGATGLNPAIQ